jgi:hypothetical protein
MTINLAARHVLDSIEERDLDLPLMIAMNGSESFRNHFIKKVTGNPPARFEKAWRGLFGPNGETDLTVVYSDSIGGRAAILIEDKIDASFQPGQAARYRERGDLGIKNGDWTRFTTCLCAPEAYAKPYAAGPDWDCAVYIEEVIALLSTCADSYTAFLAEAIGRALIKSINGGFVEIPAASAFWKNYRDLCMAEFPDLSISRLPESQGANPPWPCFAADRLPHRIRLEHKPPSNCVDLTLKDFAYQQALNRLSGRLPEGFAVKSTPPSSAIRILASPIIATEPFDQQIEATRHIFRAARRLLRLWPKVRPLLDFPEPFQEEREDFQPAPVIMRQRPKPSPIRCRALMQKGRKRQDLARSTYGHFLAVFARS